MRTKIFYGFLSETMNAYQKWFDSMKFDTVEVQMCQSEGSEYVFLSIIVVYQE